MELYRISTKTIEEVVSELPTNNPLVPLRPTGLKKELLNLIKGEDGIINGKQLRSFAFPIGEFDVFISHSHNDLEKASLFALWLETKCRFRVFLDSFAWNSADELLLEIDNQFCKHENGIYDYHRRNHSTAHVHTMLSMSIMDVIKHSKVGIFIDSPHSINLHDLSNSVEPKHYLHGFTKRLCLCDNLQTKDHLSIYSAMRI